MLFAMLHRGVSCALSILSGTFTPIPPLTTTGAAFAYSIGGFPGAIPSAASAILRVLITQVHLGPSTIVGLLTSIASLTLTL